MKIQTAEVYAYDDPVYKVDICGLWWWAFFGLFV